MIDFLKAHPSVTKDDYLWSWSIPQIRLALFDNTHTEYLTEEQAKIEKRRNTSEAYTSVQALANDFGAPIIM